jgi:hypothetical protein
MPLAFGLLLVVAQHKDWTYQRIPSITVAAFVVGLVTVEGGIGASLRRWDFARLSAAAAVLASLVGLSLRARRHEAGADDARLFSIEIASLIERRSSRGSAVLFLSTAPYPAYPATLIARAAPGSRYLWTFPIALFHPRFGDPGAPEASADEDEQRFLDELDEDIQTRKPSMIFVDGLDPGWGLPPGASVARYLRGTRIWDTIREGYRRHSDLGPLEVWERASAW